MVSTVNIGVEGRKICCRQIRQRPNISSHCPAIRQARHRENIAFHSAYRNYNLAVAIDIPIRDGQGHIDIERRTQRYYYLELAIGN